MRCLRGYVDSVSRDRILGWAIDDAAPLAAVAVQVVVNGALNASTLANRHRRDIEQAGIGNGRCAFEHHFTPPLSPLERHVVELRYEANGQPITPPHVLEPAGRFDGALEQVIEAAIGGLGDTGEEARVLAFLEAQAGRLRQIRAEARGALAARDHARQMRYASPDYGPPPLRALVIDHEWPEEERDGGSQAVLSHIAALQELGYGVSLIAARQLDRAPPAQLAERGIDLCAAPFYASVEEVLRRQENGFDLIYLHRIGNAARYLTLARDYQPAARILFSVADLHYLRLLRQAAAEDRPELQAESNRVRLAECTAAWQADAVLTHSPVEAMKLRELVPAASVHVVPWAVPITPPPADFAARSGVVFIGNYGHPPNIDAARHLAEDIMPIVWQHAPDMICRIAGAAMPPIIRDLAGPNIDIVGHVPDLAALLGACRLSAAPLRYGAGIKGKVLSSLAAGIPCAMSPTAAEGLDVQDDAIGATAPALAEIILRLHTNPNANRDAAIAGQAMVDAMFNPTRVTATLGAAIEAARK